MTVEVELDILRDKFRELVTGSEKISDELINMIIQRKRSLEVDFHDILTFDRTLADLVIERPRQVLPEADKVVREIVEEKDPDTAKHLKRFYFRVRNPPLAVPLRKLRSEYIGRLIKIEGIVTRQTPPEALPTQGAVPMHPVRLRDRAPAGTGAPRRAPRQVPQMRRIQELHPSHGALPVHRLAKGHSTGEARGPPTRPATP